MRSTEYTGRRPPDHLVALATELGGLNRFGDPNFRLVWAEDRRSPVAGLWVDWPKGSSKLALDRPLRRVYELRHVKRYPAVSNMWVIEKWAAPEIYGPRTRWYSPAYAGGTLVPVRDRVWAAQGEYPERGDYEYTGFALTDSEICEPTISAVIVAFKRQDELMPSNPINRIRKLTYLSNEQAKATEAAYDEYVTETAREMLPAFGMKSFSAPGPKRRESVVSICERLGIRSHPF